MRTFAALKDVLSDMENSIVKQINVNGQLLDLSYPQVMGILNLTPDSFYAGSRKQTEAEIVERTHNYG